MIIAIATMKMNEDVTRKRKGCYIRPLYKQYYKSSTYNC